MSGWREQDGALERTYELASFAEAVAFVGRVAALAEAENHHPGIAVDFRRVTLRWTTHSAGGITGRDRELAGRSDELAAPPPLEPAGAPVVELGALSGRGPLWGTATGELNATLLAWPAGEGTAEHVNAERDVLLILLAGSATVTVDGEASTARAGDVVILERGRSRAIEAGPNGVRYLSVHRRRAALQIASLGDT